MPADVFPMDEASFRRRLKRATLVLSLSLGLPLLVLLALVIILLRSAAWVDHSTEVIGSANALQGQLLALQTSFRGYRLSGDEAYLRIFEEERRDLVPVSDALTGLVSDNPVQASQLAVLEAETTEWLASVDEELVRVRGHVDLIRDPSFLLETGPIFEAMQQRLDRFVKEERRLRVERDRSLRRSVALLLTTLGIVALVGIPLLALWLQRLLRQVSASYQASLEAAEMRSRQLQVTLSSIGDAVVATNNQGRVTFLNPAAEALMGWTNTEANGRELTEVFPIINEQTRAPVPNPVEQVLRGNAVVGLANHTVMRTRDGREVPIEDSAAPIRDDDGAVVGVILVFHDVTEKRAVERHLQASENLKSAILNTALDGFILMDHEGIIGDWNFAAENIFGYKRAEVVGKLLGDMIVPEALRDLHRKGLARYVATREATILGQRYELPALRKDGSEFPCELAITHIPGTEPPLFAGYTRDVSARKETEYALQDATRNAEASALAVAEAAERFRLLSEVVSLQVWTARPDGELDFANAECREYFGVEDDREVLGNEWTRYVHPNDLPRAAAAWRKALASGKHYEVEFRLRAAGGNYRWFLVRAEAMRDEANRVAKWFGTNTDVDDLKAAQAEAERASRAKDNFLAVLSHELRTPLTPVLMTASALHQDNRLPADVRAQLGMMERNIALEARLIDDLLDLTRITRGKLPLRPQLCDAHSLIGLAVEIVRDEAQVKAIALEQEFQAEKSGLMADPSRFQQVIWNLLRNAVKFTPQGGTVSIRTRDVSDDAGAPWLSIEVSDSGVGIDPDAIERIFKPFEQADLTGEHRFGGIGLGLSIARAIVDLHGGTIRAESAGSGKGSLFVVELPGATKPPAGAAELPEEARHFLPGSGIHEAAAAAPAHSLRLLVVEDHEATLQVLTRLLTRAGHKVVAAASVAAALEAAAKDEFDVVVSDLGLPDGTGNGLMEQLRDRYQLRGIALTGYGMEEDVERSRQAGFVAHLIKPVDLNQLRRALAPFEAPPKSGSA